MGGVALGGGTLYRFPWKIVDLVPGWFTNSSDHLSAPKNMKNQSTRRNNNQELVGGWITHFKNMHVKLDHETLGRYGWIFQKYLRWNHRSLDNFVGL